MTHIHTIPLNIEKLVGGTAHMDATEFGAYMSLLICCYQTKNNLPNEDKRLSRMAKCTLKTWLRVRPVVEQKFIVTETSWSHEVAQKEIDNITSLSTKNRANALKRYKTDLPVAERPQCQTPANTSINKIKEDTNVSSPPTPQRGNGVPSSFLMPDGNMLDFDGLFERMWLLYPSIRDKGHKGRAKDELRKKLTKGDSYEKIGRGVARYRAYCDETGEKQPDFFRWIRDGGYERDYQITTPQPAAGRAEKLTTADVLREKLDQLDREEAADHAPRSPMLCGPEHIREDG